MSGFEGLEDLRNERLRDIFASISEMPGNGDRCPPAEHLWDSARGRLRGRANEDLIVHLGECGACAAAWRLGMDLGAGEDRASAPVGLALQLRRSWLPVVAAAALLVVVSGVAILQRYAAREAPAEYRSATYACGESLVPRDEPLPRGNCVLRWSACAEGSVYDVRVTTESLEIIARARELDRPEFVVPEASLRAEPGASRILWQVTAHLPGGGVSESPTYTTSLR